MATADNKGQVNTAIYAKPHVFDDSTVGFIIRDRLSRKNLLENGNASYLFYEKGSSFKGLRLKLLLLGESNDQNLISELSRRPKTSGNLYTDESRFLVTFSVDKCLSLIGGEEVGIQ